MHENSCFITLTYSNENLGDNRLDYSHFQKFMKKLRKLQDEPIGFFCTGEYGEKTKRMHWHAILFNYRPKDAQKKYKTERGDQVFSSETLQKLWGYGIAEFGSVTFESAGYCARYAAKKLVHGQDGSHSFQPISKKSNKHAIGKKWLETYWPDVFNHGQIVLPNGTTCSIPRYYEKWFKENHPEKWLRYVTETKSKKALEAAAAAEKEAHAHAKLIHERSLQGKWIHPLTLRERKALITKSKFKMLQDYLKL